MCATTWTSWQSLQPAPVVSWALALLLRTPWRQCHLHKLHPGKHFKHFCISSWLEPFGLLMFASYWLLKISWIAQSLWFSPRDQGTYRDSNPFRMKRRPTIISEIRDWISSPQEKVENMDEHAWSSIARLPFTGKEKTPAICGLIYKDCLLMKVWLLALSGWENSSIFRVSCHIQLLFPCFSPQAKSAAESYDKILGGQYWDPVRWLCEVPQDPYLPNSQARLLKNAFLNCSHN